MRHGLVCLRLPKSDERAAHQLTLERVAGSKGLGDAGIGFGLRLAFRYLVFFGVERFIWPGFEGREANTAHNVAACFLETPKLGLQVWLAGAGSGLVERENVIQ